MQHESNRRSRPQQPHPIGERLLLFGGFALVGVVGPLLGPLIPELESEWGIGHADTASLFLMQFATSSLGSVLSSFHLRRSIVSGYALASLGLVGIVAGGWSWARLSLCVLGFAMGLLISGSNLMVAHKHPENRGAALSTLNLIWGLGAVTCPLLFAVLGEAIGPFGLLAVLAALTAAASAGLALTLTDPQSREDGPAPTPLPAGRRWVLLPIAGLCFFYVGSETSLGGWLISLANQLSDADGTFVSLLIGSGFWGAILVGRAGAALVLRRLSEQRTYAACLALAGAGALVLYAADSRAAVGAGAVLSGLGLAPLYPLTVSILAQTLKSSRSRLAGLVLACGGFGGAVLPWLTGRLSAAAGPNGASLSRGFLVPIAGLALMAALYALHLAIAREASASSGDSP